MNKAKASWHSFISNLVACADRVCCSLGPSFEKLEEVSGISEAPGLPGLCVLVCCQLRSASSRALQLPAGNMLPEAKASCKERAYFVGLHSQTARGYLLPLIAMETWACYSTSVCLSFLFYKVLTKESCLVTRIEIYICISLSFEGTFDWMVTLKIFSVKDKDNLPQGEGNYALHVLPGEGISVAPSCLSSPWF